MTFAKMRLAGAAVVPLIRVVAITVVVSPLLHLLDHRVSILRIPLLLAREVAELALTPVTISSAGSLVEL
jgi:hypothetical protein